jgi:Bax protein
MDKKILYFLVLSIAFIFTGCVQGDVKLVKKSYFKTKLGTIENQKLVTTLPEIKKPIVAKKKKKKINPTVQQKKQRFKDILVPIVTEVYNTLQTQYKNVKRDMEQGKNQEFIERLKIEYKAKNNQELLQALKPHPISITLAQAAIESAWLTSRFTIKANNIFGVWSFNSEEPRIEASATRGERRIYLKKYKTYKAAVADYYKTLAKTWAYDEFRKQRVLTNDPYVLVQFLQSYSEKKERYTKLLARMIEYNKFHKHDIK